MIEQKTANTILSKPITVDAGGKQYEVARPTIATLIEVSRCVAELTGYETIDKEKVVPFILTNAKDSGHVLARIAATLIVGVHDIEKISRKRKKIRFRLFRRKYVSDIDKLSIELINNASSEELNEIISQALSYQQIGFFLSSIISLSGTSLTKPTKKIE